MGILVGVDKIHVPWKELKIHSIEDCDLRLPRDGFNLHILVSYADFSRLLSLLSSDKICTYNGN